VTRRNFEPVWPSNPSIWGFIIESCRSAKVAPVRVADAGGSVALARCNGGDPI
jgi:hypothetical protein